MTTILEHEHIVSSASVMLGPSASEQWRRAPEHLAMVLARYRAASALIGSANSVLEFGCGEGIGARMLAAGREIYHGLDVDPNAVAEAKRLAGHLFFSVADVLNPGTFFGWDAVVALDVIEHVEDGARLVAAGAKACKRTGVFVVGTPSSRFDDLASERSKADHVRTYSHAELHALMAERFAVVQSFGMQDSALHIGHPDARHYLMMAGVVPIERPA